MSIYLTAFIKSKPGQSEALKALLEPLMIPSRQEAACLQYNLHQSSENRDQFIFWEEWANATGLELHNKQPHILEFRKASESIIEGEVLIYKSRQVLVSSLV